MKWSVLAAVLAMFMLSACTTIHPDRRTVLDWNIDLVLDENDEVHSPEDLNDLDAPAQSIIDWVLVQPIQIAMLPVSWAIDTFILNPIDAWKTATLSIHEDREVRYDVDDSDEAAVKNYQYVPAGPPWIISDLLDAPRFVARWLWASVYWNAEPHDSDAYDDYWDAHIEDTAR